MKRLANRRPHAAWASVGTRDEHLGPIVGGGLRRLHDIATARGFQDFLSFLRPGFVVAMYRNQVSAFPDPARKTLRLDFGDACADQSTNQAAGRAGRSGARERGDDRTGGYERSDPRNRERANADEPTQNAADGRASACACGDTLRGLRIDLMREISRGTIPVWKNRRHIAIAEPGSAERFECVFKRATVRVDPIRNHIR